MLHNEIWIDSAGLTLKNTSLVFTRKALFWIKSQRFWILFQDRITARESVPGLPELDSVWILDLISRLRTVSGLQCLDKAQKQQAVTVDMTPDC